MAFKENLIPVEPIGIGTPMVESLYSYIIRTAWANDVKPTKLLQLLYTKAGLISDKTSQFQTSKILSTINSVREETNKIITELETLTSKQNLSFLTISRWSNIIRNGIQKRDRWFDPNSVLTYEPLLFSLTPVYQSLEGKALEKHCHACHRPSGYHPSPSSLNCCYKCGRLLDRYSDPTAKRFDNTSRVMLNLQYNEYYSWATKAVGDLLSYGKSPSKLSLSEALRAHLSCMSKGELKLTKSRLPFSAKLLHDWIDEKTLPTLKQFIQLCHSLQTSPIELLTQTKLQIAIDFETNTQPISEPPATKTNSLRIERDFIEASLSKAIKRKAFATQSFYKFCKEDLEIKPEAVKRLLPDLAEDFLQSHSLYKKLRAHVKRTAREEEIREAAWICSKMGLPITGSSISHLVTEPKILNFKWASELIQEIRDAPEQAYEMSRSKLLERREELPQA
ncbi:TniQ family protein [Pelagicoccus sp. SDUM812005]|uniref:TniQ family protein n=1 Tax=Pelagicoccus sp. SDUM812005 TaxID=3041257 RepID=UPI00280C653A|nr:TniQ family protein [Pelagicoccus sp. SDUM812005]MDQ8180373.1 TniQ family protein [Pelagicoccus sp. SDUM812005]